MNDVSVIEILCLIVYYTYFIVLAIKGKIKIAVISLLLLVSLYSIILGLLMIYALPVTSENTIVNGPVLPIVPIMVGCIVVAIALLTFKSSSNGGKNMNYQPSTKKSWMLLILGVLVNIIGLFVIINSIYVPKIFGYSTPVPKIGVPSFIILNCISAFLIYLGSKRNTEQKPNLLRWVSFFIVLLTISLPLGISCIFLYAYPAPSQVRTVEAFWSGIISIGLLPYSLVLLYISREYAKTRA